MLILSFRATAAFGNAVAQKDEVKKRWYCHLSYNLRHGVIYECLLT